MKPKIIYKMEVFSNGDAQEQIINLISSHNNGDCEFTLEELQTYLKLRGFLYSLSYNSQIILNNDNEASVIYNSKEIMKINRMEMYELEKVDKELELQQS